MNSIELAKQIRRAVLRMTHKVKGPHLSSCLSCADILAVWYSEPREAKLIVSKGHAAAAVYAALALKDDPTIAPVDLEHYCEPGALLECSHVSSRVPGVVHSTGSLGHGLPVACGMALAGQPVAVLMSDAELQCGTTWEAALFAARHGLSVTVIVDRNKWQALGVTGAILPVGLLNDWPLGWRTVEADGHDHAVLHRLDIDRRGLRPTAIIARTIKGKGVSFIEDDPQTYHYRACTDEELARALAEIDHG